MSVMLTNIDKLKTDAGKIKTYVDSYQSETGTMNRRFSEKIAGSESEALNKYIEIMNDYSNTVFSVHPGNVKELARAIEDYQLHGDVTNFISDTVTTVYGTAAEIISVEMTTTGVAWVLVKIVGVANPVVLAITTAVTYSYVVEPVVDWSKEKVNEAVQNVQNNHIESKAEWNAIKDLQKDGYTGSYNIDSILNQDNFYDKDYETTVPRYPSGGR